MPEFTAAPGPAQHADDEITYPALFGILVLLAGLVAVVLAACLLILRPAQPRDYERSSRADLPSLIPHLPPKPILDAYPGAQRQAWEDLSASQLRRGAGSGQAPLPADAIPIDAAMRALIDRHTVLNRRASDGASDGASDTASAAVPPGPPPAAAPTEDALP